MIVDDVAGDRKRASTAQLTEKRPFDLHPMSRRPVVDRGECVDGRASSARHSTATQPCPTAGTNCSMSISSSIRSVISRISSAARAITIAPPSGILPSRVSMLPRSSTNDRSGRTAASCARRRTDPEATVAPSASPSSVEPTSTSCGLRRSVNAAITRPAAGSDGRSFAEWTARSARPSRTARWTSLTNTPCPPIVWRGTSWRTSPVVSISTRSTARPLAAVIDAATTLAWASAWREPRVASRSGAESFGTPAAQLSRG